MVNDRKSLAKPRGGLWSSTYHPAYGSARVQWCVAYRYTDPFELTWTVCTVPDSARIAIIDGEEDLAAVIAQFPRALRARSAISAAWISSGSRRTTTRCS